MRIRSEGLYEDTPDPVYLVPSETVLSATLDATNVGASTVADVALFQEAADYVFAVRAKGRTLGQQVGLAHYPDDGQFAVVIDGFEGTTTFDMTILRIDENGEEEFSGEGLEIEGGVGLLFWYADWAGDGTPLTVGVDIDGDGEIDETFTSDDSE